MNVARSCANRSTKLRLPPFVSMTLGEGSLPPIYGLEGLISKILKRGGAVPWQGMKSPRLRRKFFPDTGRPRSGCKRPSRFSVPG